MRRCFKCQQMKPVVTVEKKPDGRRGYLCSGCHVDSVNDWYYWTQNQHCHFIQFRLEENKVATATIFPLASRFVWKVNGPCWLTYEAEGIVETLDMAKQTVDTRVERIIAQEFQPEYVAPLG